ncbi:phosphotransferase [Actinopolymorpha sp. B11F2]|uniref:phosphotransferase family protein n=1 Tax=Actinopolymorpha sp. B11F2 TaxID=3160862 RepID=UPI0032E3A426
MPLVDIADDSYVVASPGAIAARLKDPAFWQSCWPDVALRSYHDRDAEGMRWYAAGAVVGTAELWLEPWRDGTLVHVFLRGDPPSRWSARRLERLRRAHALALKAALFAVKDEMEADRDPGTRLADRVARLVAHRATEPSRSGIAHLLAELADDDTGPLDLVDVARLDGGIATATHLLRVSDRQGLCRDLVLKRYLADDDTAALEWERLGFAQRCGVATPAPVGVDLAGRWFGTPALVMTALPGAMVYDPVDPKAWVAALARALVGIHRTDLSPPLPAAVRRPPSWRSFDRAGLPESWRGERSDGVARVADRLRLLGPAQPEVLCHGDFHPGNVLFDGDAVVGVVDWSGARIEPAESDVANCRVELALIGGDLPDLFAADYAEARGRPLEHLPLWDALAGAGTMSWLPYAGEKVNQAGAEITREQALVRIERFVDDALARAGAADP